VEGGIVRTKNLIALLSASALVLACGRDERTSSMNDELKHDLELAASSATTLASAQDANTYAPTEIAPRARPEKAPTLKKGAGPKSVRSKTPTVKAAPQSEVAESESQEMQVSMTPSSSPAPTSAPAEPSVDESVPAVPRPVPASIPVSQPTDQGTVSQGSTTGTSTGEVVGSVLGGILGAVIRGGGSGGIYVGRGDGDRCEIHRPQGSNRPQPRGGGVYRPSPRGTGTIPTRGGIVYARSH